jgi:CRP/FNR family transcriptional regulator
MDDILKEKTCEQCLKKCLFFSAIKESEQEEFIRNRKSILYSKGETIVKQGSHHSNIFIIHEGLVKIILEGSNSKNLLLKVIIQKEYLLRTNLWGSHENSFTASALKETTICNLNIPYFKKVFLNNFIFWKSLFANFKKDDDFLLYRLKNLGTKNLPGRLADSLLYFSDEKFKGEDIYTHLTRKDLAEFSAMSVESLMRLLTQYKYDKLIQILGRRIEIINLEMIRTICKTG